MLEFKNILSNGEKEIQNSLQELLDIMKDKIKKKNSTIIQLQNEIRTKDEMILQEQKKNQEQDDFEKKYNQLIQKEAEREISTEKNDDLIKKILKTNKRICKILKKKYHLQQKKIKYTFHRKNIKIFLFLRDKYLLTATERTHNNVVNKEDMEAFKIIMLDLEGKKTKINELNEELKIKSEENENLTNDLRKQQELFDKTILEKNNLQTINNNYKSMLEEQDVQLKKYVNISEENVKNQFEIQNLEIQLKEKNTLSTAQQNIIKQLENTLKEKDIKINELKNRFFELVNDFNNILSRIK